MANIKFEFFEGISPKELASSLEGFIGALKLKKENIVNIGNNSVLYNNVLVYRVMLAYETPSPETSKLKEEFQSMIKKNSGPRTGMKRGPYKKTRDRMFNATKDSKRTYENTGGETVHENLDDIYGGTKTPVGDVVPGVVMSTDKSPPASEREYYEGLNMVVVPPQKHVRENGEP